ncbi:PQQ-binding-like beta-propeller repeat protein [Tundrisphaera sp. TA3]|uniref:PQQ-binding-like beta-propeller repeat protein n=1 Tax=Tundrisphaera sp. TA3 TaxID=3435775 RepID=UPI003EBC90C3
MPRRLALACVGLMLAAATARAQAPIASGAIPSRTALSRIGLDMHWAAVVPLQGAEKVTSLSIDSGLVFAQTNLANFFAFDGESGRMLWSAHLGRVTTQSFPAAVNSFGVFVTNSNRLFALDRRTGGQMWSQELSDTPSCATAANETRVVVGLESGKLAGYDAKTGATDWFFSTNARISSRPQLTERVVAVGSQDGKVLVSRSEKYVQLYRFATSNKIVAPLANYGIRTLLIPSTDHVLYAVDLFTGQELWNHASGSAIVQEPLVADKDIFLVNEAGELSALDAETGQPRWAISTLGGRILSVSGTKLYLETHDDDLFVVDRATGKTIFDPRMTYQRSGVNLRDFTLGMTNRFDDRLYLGMKTGLLICLRESAQVRPRLLRDPNAKPFGYIPPEGYPNPDAPQPIPSAEPAAEAPANP